MGETDFDNLGAANLEMGGKEISGTEISVLDGVTPGTAKASSAVVLDANKDIRGVGVGGKVTVASGDGAIAVKNGTVVITKGSAAALTLADPVAGTDDGCCLTVLSTTAFAHTVDNSAGSGINAGGAAKDVGTYGAAIGNNLVIEAYNGKWYLISQIGVTLG